MKTTIIEGRVAKAALVFPGVFRSQKTGSIWLAKTPSVALRVLIGSGPSAASHLADEINETDAPGQIIDSPAYEQITTPITIRFDPTA